MDAALTRDRVALGTELTLMPHYQSEYHLGRGVGRVFHSFQGYQALIMILVMTGLSLTFGLLNLFTQAIMFALRAARLLLVALLITLVAILSVPFRVAQLVARALGSRRLPLKPAGIPFDDLV